MIIRVSENQVIRKVEDRIKRVRISEASFFNIYEKIKIRVFVAMGRKIKSIIHPFLKNKANFNLVWINICSLLTSEYEIFRDKIRQENKANSKPILTRIQNTGDSGVTRPFREIQFVGGTPRLGSPKSARRLK
jgi:hypothetical protein